MRWENHYIEGLGRPPEWAFAHKKAYIKLFKAMVLDRHRFEGKVLEIGAGSCWAASLVKKTFPDSIVYATDISVKALLKGGDVSRLMGVKLDHRLACDAQRLPFRDGVFSTVLGIAVIHHMHDPKKALREIWRVLKPRGTYIGLREGMASRALKPLYRWLSGAIKEERVYGSIERVLTFGEWVELLSSSGFDYKLILKHEPSLGVKRIEKLCYKLFKPLPESIIKHLVATIEIFAVKAS